MFKMTFLEKKEHLVNLNNLITYINPFKSEFRSDGRGVWYEQITPGQAYRYNNRCLVYFNNGYHIVIDGICVYQSNSFDLLKVQETFRQLCNGSIDMDSDKEIRFNVTRALKTMDKAYRFLRDIA